MGRGGVSQQDSSDPAETHGSQSALSRALLSGQFGLAERSFPSPFPEEQMLGGGGQL